MKYLTVAVVVLVVSALVLTGCGGAATQAASAPPIPAGDAARGKTVFDGTCSACHGPDAKGITGLGKDLTTSEFAKGLSDAELVAFVKRGRPTGDSLNTTGVEMPAKGGNTALTDQDLADVVAYIRTLEK